MSGNFCRHSMFGDRRALLSLCMAIAFVTGSLPDAYARSSVGYDGRTHKQSPPSGGLGCDGGGGCHNQAQESAGNMSVVISGPSSVAVGGTGNYTVTATRAAGGSGKKMGVNVAASGGTLGESASFLTVVNGEIVHTQTGGTLHTTDAGGTASYSFTFSPGSSTSVAGDTFTIYAVARLGFSGGWRHAGNFVVSVPKLSQTITFGAQSSPRTYSTGATFSISPQASASSGLAITYTSDTPSVCTTPGTTSTTVTMQGAGTCTIRANQGGNANYNAASDVLRSITINKGNQTVTFNSQVVFPTYSPGGTFTLAPAATASSGLAIVYSSSTPGVCTKPTSGTLVNIIAAGTCTISATQPGDADWNAAPVLASHTRSITIAKSAQTISFPAQTSKPFVLNGTFNLTAASASSGLAVTYTSLTPLVCTTPGTTSTTVTMLDNGTCTIEATQTGNSNYNAATPVPQDTLLTELPVAPVMGTRYAGDGRATITFGAGLNSASILHYTATCSAALHTTRTGTSATPSSPIIVLGLDNGTTYTCSITATNSFGTGPASASGTVLPDAPPPNVAPAIRSGSTFTFKVGATQTFRVISTGTPDAAVAIGGVALPSGMTYTTNVKLPGAGFLGGTPAAGTVGNYAITFQATNAAGSSAVQNFTLVVAKGDPVITFPDPADREYSPTPFALTATSSSGLPVTYTVAGVSVGICSVTGSNVTMLATGTCSIIANSAANASYNAAPSVAQSLVIAQASQSITFGAAAARTYAPGLSYTLAPLASASSGLPVAYASLTPGVCSIVGTTVSVLSGGVCTIEASQDGNALYLSAADVQQNTVINPASQTITFPAQAGQPFSAGGSFPISPLATASSGLPVEYASATPLVCSVIGSTVNILTVGLCNVTATQAGDQNYAPAPAANRGIAINAVAPGAPVLDETLGSDATARLYFTPSSADGGAPVTAYRGTCNPGNISATSADSPVVVTGLVNNVAYSCTVAAQNAAGNSAESNALTATPVLRSGTVLWNAVCSGCHGDPPSGTRFNAAGDSGTILQYVRSTVADMIAEPAVQALTANELAEIAKYIKQQLPAISASTTYQTPVPVDVGFPSHITLNSVAATFTAVEVVTPPVNGVMSAFTGTSVTYTPNPGFAGTDTFTYRGFRTSPNLQGEPRTVTITVQVPQPPVVTSLATANGVFGQAFSYQITATNSPASFGASGLGPGASINTATGLISGTPGVAGVFNVTVSATNPGGTGTLPVQVTISAANQSVTFGAQGSQTFLPGGTFAINPVATASSGLPVSYASLTPGICTVGGTTVTMVSAGVCSLAANQPGNANYNAALQQTQSVTINATAPGAPLIGAATAGDGQAAIGFSPPANTGGSPITSYSATCSPAGAGSNAVSPITVSGLANGTPYTCSVTATNAAALTGPASSTVMVTPTATPVPPLITSSAATTFTVLSAGSFTVTATGTPTPVRSLSGTLPAGVTFTAGNGALSGTPAAGTVASYPLTVTATNGSGSVMQSFTLTVAKAAQAISFANPGARSFSLTPFAVGASASSGLPVTLTSNTASVCTVSGANVTMITTGVCSISADQAGNGDFNAAPQVTQGFSINAASQTISFGAQTSPRNFSTTSFAISPLASASSGLSVAYSSTTPAVCTVSGTAVTPVAAGICTIAANQAGNANFSAAPQITQNVTLNAVAPGAPSIGVGTGADAQVSISFTPPANNGGSPISQYNVTCTPSGSASGAASPVAVTGLTNGTPYTCAVTATNAAALTGPASGNVTVTPTSADGAAIWSNVCFLCHGPAPAANQLNGAGNTATVLNYVRANQPLMQIFPTVQALTQAELAAVAAYIGNAIPANEVTTAHNTPAPVSVSGHITLNTISFTDVEVVTPPSNGNVSAFTGTTATYTPNPGFSGTDSFTYRGKRTSPTALDGDPRTVTINVLPAAPAITSPGAANGTFGQPFAYQIAASGTPTSFGASGLPAGLSVDTVSGAISGTPSEAGVFNASVSATNASGSGNAALTVTIAPAAQTIAFGTQVPASRPFVPGGTFGVNPLATGGASGNPVVYSSTAPGVCTVSGVTVTIVAAGTCTLAANQSGNGNYAAAPQVTQNVTITPVVPGVPAIGGATPGNAQAQIGFTAPSQDGGSPVIDYTATCTAAGQPTRTGTGAAAPLLVTSLVNGVTYACSVTARNAAGSSGASATVDVTPALVTAPGAPVIGLATAGNASASIAFSPPASNGGAAITQYTATCTPGGATGNSATSPITVNGLSNGVTYSCSVTATNAAGTGPASQPVDVTPEAPIALVAVMSRKTHGAADHNVPITGPTAVEPRSIGAGHRIVFQFDSAVTSVTSVTAVDHLAAPVNVSTAMLNNELIVTLTGIADNSRVTISVTGVNGALNPSAALGFLVGDVNGAGSVNASDIAAVKANLNLPVNAGNFRMDVNASGTITSHDVSAAKARAGQVLPL